MQFSNVYNCDGVIFYFYLADAPGPKYYRRFARYSIAVGRTIETAGSVRIILTSRYTLSTRITISSRDWRKKAMRKRWFYQKVNRLFSICWNGRHYTLIYNRLKIRFYSSRLIKHTEKILEEKEEKLCVKVLRTLREMMAIDPEYGEKVSVATFYHAWNYMNHIYRAERNHRHCGKGHSVVSDKMLVTLINGNKSFRHVLCPPIYHVRWKWTFCNAMTIVIIFAELAILCYDFNHFFLCITEVPDKHNRLKCMCKYRIMKNTHRRYKYACRIKNNWFVPFVWLH